MVTYERTLEYFAMQRDRSMAMIEKFAKEVVESPLYTLEWSDKYFQAAAEHWAACYLLEYLTHKDLIPMQQILEEVEGEVLRLSRTYPSSTSIASNHVDNCKRVALAKAYEMLTR